MIRADDHPTLDAAVAAWLQVGKGELVLGAKDYDLQAPIVGGTRSNLSIRGEGNASAIIPRFVGASILQFGDDSGEARNLLLENFAIIPPKALTGFGVSLRRVARGSIRNVDIGTPDRGGWRLAGGIWAAQFDDLVIDNVQAMTTQMGLVLNGGADQSFGADAWIGGGSKVMNASSVAALVDGSVGIYIGGGCGGVSVEDADVIYCGRGVVLATDLAQGAQNREVFLDDVFVDSCGWDGVRALARSFGSLHLTGTWVASCGLRTNGGHEAYGVRVEPDQLGNASGLIDGADIFNHHGSGVGLNGGSWNISGSTIRTNGRGSKGGDGVGIYNSSVKANVSGSTITGNGNASMGRGLTVDANAVDILVSSNRIQGNGQKNMDFPNLGTRRMAGVNLIA